MAPAYKLTYFNITALGEPLRWLLAYNEIEFEDDRIEFEDFYSTVKATLPYGKLPVLEINGKKLTQSAAIGRYLAKKAKLTGKDEWDAVQADSIVDTIADFRAQIAGYFWDPNPETKKTKLEPLQKETIPFYLTRLEKTVKENGGYFVNGQLTWADIYYISHADYLQSMSEGMDFWTPYPNLSQLKAKVLQIPQIKAWVAKRPDTK